MNAPAIAKAATVPATQRAPASARAKVAEVLAQQRDKLEAPFRVAEQLSERRLSGALPRHDVPRWLCDWVPRYGEGVTGAWVAVVRPGSYDMDRAAAWLGGVPSKAELEASRATLQAAIDAPVNQRALAMSVGILLDAYPQVREARDAYYATLVHDIEDEGYGPHIVAEACRRLRRTLRFVPSVAEALDACREAKSDLAHALTYADRLLVAVNTAEAAKAALAVPVTEWPGDWWAEAMHCYRRDRRYWSDRLGPPPGADGCKVPADVLKQWGIA
ncbi:hypothetical protein [Brevundimonas sp.]|uniref:hypothetical protein n=1 Tax=Brevundimonas sp. TaxID=1871086 RepID=UPI0035156E3E